MLVSHSPIWRGIPLLQMQRHQLSSGRWQDNFTFWSTSTCQNFYIGSFFIEMKEELHLFLFSHTKYLGKISRKLSQKHSIFPPTPCLRIWYSSLGNQNRSCIKNQFSEQFIKSTEESLLLSCSPQMMCWLHIIFASPHSFQTCSQERVKSGKTHYSSKYEKLKSFRGDYKCHFPTESFPH